MANLLQISHMHNFRSFYKNVSVWYANFSWLWLAIDTSKIHQWKQWKNVIIYRQHLVEHSHIIHSQKALKKEIKMSTNFDSGFESNRSTLFASLEKILLKLIAYSKRGRQQ